MATQAEDVVGGYDKFIIFVDGEKFNAPSPVMTPNGIIKEATDLDPANHYLIRTSRDQESYQGRGLEQVTLVRRDQFQVVSLAPTTVS